MVGGFSFSGLPPLWGGWPPLAAGWGKGTGEGGPPAVQPPCPPRAADFAARCCGGKGGALSTAASGSAALWAAQWAGALGRRDGAAPWPRRKRNDREPLTWTTFDHPAHLGRADRRDGFPRRRVGRMIWSLYSPRVFLFRPRRKTTPPRGGEPNVVRAWHPRPGRRKTRLARTWRHCCDNGTQTSGPLHLCRATPLGAPAEGQPAAPTTAGGL